MKSGTVISARGLVAFVLLCAAAPLQAQERVTKEVPRQPADQAQQGQQKEHVVRKGDTLWDLARSYLNDPYRWPLIYDANRNVVRNPHWIYPSEKLVIPGMKPDTMLVGTPVAQAPAGPNRSRFFVPERVDTGPTIISAEGVRIPLVQPLEWMAAPWIADTSQLKVIAHVYKPYDPRDQNDKLTQEFHPMDKLVLSTMSPLAAKDQLLAIRLTRNLRGVGWIIEPMGILRIDSVTAKSAVASVVRQFSDLKVGDVAIALPAIPNMPVGQLTDVSGGPNGTILDFLVQHPLYTNSDYAFVNLGAAQGISVGDELVAYLPDRQPSAKHPETLPSQPIAHMQVVRVNDKNATVRVTRLSNNGLEIGLPVRVSRKAP